MRRKAETKLPDMKKQPSAQAVLDEHMAALNVCDWDRIVAQYPEDARINLPGGTVVKGRAAIGDMFAGFCKDPKDGGLKGIHFEAAGQRHRRRRVRHPMGGDGAVPRANPTKAPTPTSPGTA